MTWTRVNKNGEKMNELEKGVQLGIQLAAGHCDLNAKKQDKHADALRDEADSLRTLALNHKKHKPLISPELRK